VGDLAGDAHFVTKSGQRVGVFGHGFGQELQGDGLFQAEVVGAVDFPHASFSQHGDDAVAAAE
jgi:hypothetical protein